MKTQKQALSLFALLTLTLGLLAACDDGSSPQTAPLDKATVKVDLENLASKVTSFNIPKPPDQGNGMAKRMAQAKIDSTLDCVNGLSVDEYTDSSETEGLTSTLDSTWTYGSDNKLTCEVGFESHRSEIHGYNRNSQYESWSTMTMTMSIAGDLTALQINLSLKGKGKVHYFSGYSFSMDEIGITVANSKITEYKCNLGLENGRYQVTLGLKPGIDLMSDTDPDPKAIVLRGPIQANAETVGYFEVLGDDSIVIRDANQAIVEKH